jgi:hypothetical protein
MGTSTGIVILDLGRVLVPLEFPCFPHVCLVAIEGCTLEVQSRMLY